MNTTIFRHPLLAKSIPWTLVAWTLIIVYLTTFPSERIVDVPLFKYDKLGHFLIFGGWTFLVGLIQLVTLNQLKKPLYPIPIAGVLFGAFIELLQYVLPYQRFASWEDIIANTLGCMVAYAMLLYIRKQLKQTSDIT
ncbi:MAG: VanZ family protein [Bacteroidetes bacterium]|nr:VanZ family protein [Bacteroidota bacterium]MCH8523408.1 VanZ family protein [Balneolales bacterium]